MMNLIRKKMYRLARKMINEERDVNVLYYKNYGNHCLEKKKDNQCLIFTNIVLLLHCTSLLSPILKSNRSN